MDDFVFVYFECDNFYTPYARSYAGSPRSLITSNTLPRASLSQKPSPRSPPYPTATHAPQFHLRHLQLFDTLLHRAGQADTSNEKERFASPGGSVIPGTLWAESCASTEEATRRPKIGIIKIGLLRDLSEIKLKRTARKRGVEYSFSLQQPRHSSCLAAANEAAGATVTLGPVDRMIDTITS
jgi:hypothetical protein